jgi:ABC-type antimicrobial peptide transport system permease subunit
LKKYNIPSKQQAWFSIYSFAKYTEQLNSSMAIMNYLLLAIWAISLLVGWIWVMNIMIVSVTERTREIWIRKAIWALNGDIITQFLIESVVITAIGWIIAIVLAWLAIQAVNSFHIEWINISMTTEVVVLATTLTFIIWIVSWIGPAKKAAELQPIDALRFE